MARSWLPTNETRLRCLSLLVGLVLVAAKSRGLDALTSLTEEMTNDRTAKSIVPESSMPAEKTHLATKKADYSAPISGDADQIVLESGPQKLVESAAFPQTLALKLEQLKVNCPAEQKDPATYAWQCCSLHQYEPSGLGNQILQTVNAMRFSRANGCRELSLPDCSIDGGDTTACGANRMWHKGHQHVALMTQIPTKLKVEPKVSTKEVEEGSKDAKCLDGWSNELHGRGWPYCYFGAVDWVQARADAHHLYPAMMQTQPGSADELVVHIRAGDSEKKFDDMITGWPNNNPSQMVAPCSMYVDAALTGNNGGPFKSIRLVTDTRGCAAGSSDAQNVGACSPCVEMLREKLSNVMLVKTGTVDNSLSPLDALRKDVNFLATAQSLAYGCSTFCVIGRVMNTHLRRLFLSNCKLTEKKDGIKYDSWSFLGRQDHAFDPEETLLGTEITTYDFDWKFADYKSGEHALLHAKVLAKKHYPIKID